MGEFSLGKLAKKIFVQLNQPIKIEVCKGSLLGCPKSVIEPKDLEMDILDLIDRLGLSDELKEHFPEEDVLHPTLTISISGCVNGCSNPHIKDVGLEGTVSLKKNIELCNKCGECIKACSDHVISMHEDGISINSQLCLSCGECARVCPTNALTMEKTGIRLMIGGHLGRHPHFAQTVADFLTSAQAMGKLQQFFELVIREHQNGHYVEEVLHQYEEENCLRHKSV
ncbi:MAG: 4Fe-4S binding protein [Halanaerobiales bacterium]|nr:4Fe-4S binding protein [Halanaerobiales bacterium]